MDHLIPKIIGYFINALSLFSSKTAGKISLTLFATPRNGKVTQLQSDFFDSAVIEQLEYDNLPIMTYHWSGRNETILLVHGWESNAYRWKEFIEELQKKNYNVIALDAPAHGNSGSKVFNAILYSEFINVVSKKFEPEVVIGHSVGGMASVFAQFSYNYKHLKKLVLLGAPAHFTGVLQRYVDMMGYNESVHNEIRKLVLKRFGQPPEYYSTSNFTKSIMAEGLIIHDEKDKIIPFNDAQLISLSYQNSELISTSGFGHGLKDQTIYNAILDFIIS